MKHEWVEVTVKLVGEEYKYNVDVYTQRVRYEYFASNGGLMLADIICAVNGLPAPKFKVDEHLNEALP